MENKNYIVISLGGSLIVPDEVDTEFLKGFKNLIEDYVAKGFSFAIITGGGKVCRKYQNALSEIIQAERDALDWVGIAALRLNAMLVKNMFESLAHPEVINDPTTILSFDKPIIVIGAPKPGASTDYDAVLMATNLGAMRVINLSNIDHAYDKDPKKFPDAKKLETVSWSEYRSYIPTEWFPGANAPFDPIASKYAEENGLEVAIMNGKNLSNLKDYLDGKSFIGTVIS